MTKRVIVTHHDPDLDAVGAVWMLYRFDHAHYGTARFEFVNPGDRISSYRQAELGVTNAEVTHVDTGLGKFDHHQPDRGQEFTSATKLTYEYLCQIQPDKQDDKALQTIVDIITQIDHFQEISWPDSGNLRYGFMLAEILRGMNMLALQDDQSVVHFGLTALDAVYANLTSEIKAHEHIINYGQPFTIHSQPALAIATANESVMKVAQKQGYMLVIKKDPELGHIRIKARPDAPFSLNALAEKIKTIDHVGTWFNHPGGKMLLNGSSKHRNQQASPLSMQQVVDLCKEIYG